MKSALKDIVYGAIVFAIIFVSVLSLSSLAYADSLVVEWNPPIAREDGSPLHPSEIGFYILRINGEPVTGTISATSTSYTIADVQPGEYCVDMKTVDTFGRQSVFSTPLVCKTIAPPDTSSPPKPPLVHTIMLVK